MVIFKYKQNKFEGDLNIKLCGKRLYYTKTVKYLGVNIDTNLSWQYRGISIKLNRANVLVFKTLRSIYFAIFNSYLSYCFLVWTQNCSNIQRILNLEKRLLELLIFNQGIPILFSCSNKAPS